MSQSTIRGRLAVAFVTVFGTLYCKNSEAPSGGPPIAQLVFTTQPPHTVQGNVAISPPIQVTLRDASGNLVPTGTVMPRPRRCGLLLGV